MKEGAVEGESRALWASEETLIISCEVKNAGRVLNRSIVRLRWVWAQTNKMMMTGAGNHAVFYGFLSLSPSICPLKTTDCTCTGALMTDGFKPDTLLAE